VFVFGENDGEAPLKTGDLESEDLPAYDAKTQSSWPAPLRTTSREKGPIPPCYSHLKRRPKKAAGQQHHTRPNQGAKNIGETPRRELNFCIPPHCCGHVFEPSWERAAEVSQIYKTNPIFLLGRSYARRKNSLISPRSAGDRLVWSIHVLSKPRQCRAGTETAAGCYAENCQLDQMKSLQIRQLVLQLRHGLSHARFLGERPGQHKLALDVEKYNSTFASRE
jgi:hypothetical protein